MYNRVIKAHVTAKANTDVFVGHGSIIVTVLSAQLRGERKIRIEQCDQIDSIAQME